MMEDTELLRSYLNTGAETAFRELVDRYLPLVYSAALRRVRGDEALAQDIAQSVFIDFARKASSLSRRETLSGWFYSSTRLAASKAIRGDQRRRAREQVAAAMQDPISNPEEAQDTLELKLLLDEAMDELDPADRNAVLARFFQGKNFRHVGVVLGVSGDAARMRVTRALERLHHVLTQRGVSISVATLGVALTTETVSAVPVGLAATISTCALSSAQAGSVVTLTLLKTMTSKKVAVSVLSIVAVGALVVSLYSGRKFRSELLAENRALKQEVSELGNFRTENERLSNQLALVRRDTPSLADDQLHELLRLRGEVTLLRQRNVHPTGAVAGQTQSEESQAPVLSLRLVSDTETEGTERILRPEERVDARTRERIISEEALFVQSNAVLTLDRTTISSALVSTNWQTGRTCIDINLTEEGAAQFAKVTRENLHKRIAFVLDGKLCSSPRIGSEITTGHLPIDVPFPQEHAQHLVERINAGVAAPRP